MPHNYTLTSLIQTNYGFWKNGALPHSSFHLIYSILPYLSVMFTTYWFTGVTTTILSIFPLHIYTWTRCCLGAGILSIHCCIIIFCHVMSLCRGNVWVTHHDCFPAPSPKGRREGSCSNRSVWHVQFTELVERNAMMKTVQRLPTPPSCAGPASVCLWERDPR